ncbi:MAG: DUF885 family protein [Verrucomicrobiaceae bacterium]|nr:DUF885 family protein [Verrucomicrobiaceae bacterium]
MKRHLLPFLFASAIAAQVPPRVLIEQYVADVSLLRRHWAITGDTTKSLDREQLMMQSWLQKLSELEFAKLTPTDQTDYVLMRNDLEGSLRHLSDRHDDMRELAPWLPFRSIIDGLTEQRVLGTPLNLEKAASALAPLARCVTDLQTKLKAAKEKKPDAKATSSKPTDATKKDTTIALPTAHQAQRAAETADALRESLKTWYGNYNGFLPDFSWWMKQPHEESQKALEGYAKYLREEVAGIKDKDDAPLLGKALGASRLHEQLVHEFIPYSPDELIGIAEREFAWCETQMKKAAQEMKVGDDWKRALLRVKLQYVRPGEQETFVRAEGKRAMEFVTKHDLVTVPANCAEWWGTTMLSPQAQKQIPYAAYGGHDVLVAYANEAMKHEDKMMSMRGNNRPFMRNVVPHELIPGHHLQRFMAERHLPYRGGFSTPFYVEGWSLYWEMRLWDLGYQTTPEDRIGALFWRMHRCARIIVTLKFHLGQVKPAEMVQFLIDRVGHEKFGATSEVRRFIKGDYSPLYQCGYMLGGLQLMALHREMVGSGKMTEKQFHDAILHLGPIPIELVRASLTNQPLTPDFKTSWEFDKAISRQ